MTRRKQYNFFKPKRNLKSWLIIILFALLAHVLFIVFFQPEYLNVFEKTNMGQLETGHSNPSLALKGKRFLLVNTFQEEKTNQAEKPLVKVDDSVSTQSPDFNYAIHPIDLSPIREIKGNSTRKSGDSKNRNPGIKPIPILIPWPEYPEGASKDYTGQVKLNLYVNTKGNVEEIVLLQGLALDSFNKKAIQAAKKIRFTPGSIDGKTTAMWVQISIEFQPR